MPYLRALGFAALAGAPVLLATLAVAATRPDAPGTLLPKALGVAWIAAAVAFVGALIHHRGGSRAARALGVFACLVVAGWCGFLLWVSAATA
ncbi:MAG: hypothetical protein H6719_14115 [Sandaracinaceae bacterium]|nr:hypothetical protein [Sandaracinaceae bacterium]